MRGIPALLGVASSLLLTLSLGSTTAPENSQDQGGTNSSPQTGSASLKVSLRTEDGSAFIGVATIRVMPSEGYEVPGNPTGSDGEMVFNNMAPGSYTVEASSPGFLAIRQKTQIEEGNHSQTLFLIMKPRPSPSALSPAPAPAPVTITVTAVPAPAPAAAPTTIVPAPAPAATAAVTTTPGKASWIRPGVDDVVPSVEVGVDCPLAEVVNGAGRRMKELVENLQKFDANERVEHYTVDAAGSRGAPEARTFDYLVIVNLSQGGVIQLEEYRNGSIDPSQFPAQIATTGLPGMALLFHPTMVSDFNLTCEGLGQWDGHAAWQVRFAQRPDRLNRLRVYVIRKTEFPVPLKGRAWIDAGNFQIRHLESDLIKPVSEIALTREHMVIDYGPVQFYSHTMELWLPLYAEIYWEVRGRRMYRRHTFSDFKIFGVDSAQQIQAPKESYCFTNSTNRDIAGVLTVSPAAGVEAKTVSISFTVPAAQKICKYVGRGKDLNIPPDQVGSASFHFNGIDGSIDGDVNLARESALELVPDSTVATIKQ
ncbi:MAG TPA: carboxypeptidase-like regulatory domain-containing protein [Candidatus Acidoferrales bacterium]|nr:carboxypeptidase-like regulatory domain-containing protein [Candidatus Acidoferrales bacterium]